jgi:hypothetical protein
MQKKGYYVVKNNLDDKRNKALLFKEKHYCLIDFNIKQL